MRQHFESGMVFLVVALVSAAAGLLLVVKGSSQHGLVLLLAGGMWMIVAIGVRSRSSRAKKDGDEGPGPVA